MGSVRRVATLQNGVGMNAHQHGQRSLLDRSLGFRQSPWRSTGGTWSHPSRGAWIKINGTLSRKKEYTWSGGVHPVGG